MDETRQFRQAALIYSLRQAAIFKGLPDEDVHRIASYCATESVAAGTYLFRQRDPVRGFFIVRKGLINVHRHTEDKREQIIHLSSAIWAIQQTPERYPRAKSSSFQPSPSNGISWKIRTLRGGCFPR